MKVDQSQAGHVLEMRKGVTIDAEGELIAGSNPALRLLCGLC